ncbi:Hsp20/alpha crystallin family protein [Sinomonas terrae]|uniref:Hsp20/alpha crystallin family protein n=1 Tax=Sinomonas terrae TaxID=2908838 RepID=A0ABS9U5D4_9MICC|nr:Hsp20/alpha crystallin family protein [Sinomonas terrae]MCH6471875.1 Hsp20/alpha crystallin family protein [Sinomonas terrae]
MSDLTRWFDSRRSPFELFQRLFEGDPVASAEIRVEELVDDGELVVRAELPGIDPETDVDVSVSEGQLRIEAHREERQEEKEKGGYRTEFRYGSFTRTLALPEGASADDVTATYTDGVLEIRVPIPEQKPARLSNKIEVKRG